MKRDLYMTREQYEEAFEADFKEKVEMISMYQGDVERVTLDGEWTESELKDELWDETHKVLQGENEKPGWLKANFKRAVLNEDMLHEEFIVEDICDRCDLIETYNKAYDKHRNDKPMLFGIHYFDEAARAEINKVLKNNLVTG